MSKTAINFLFSFLIVSFSSVILAQDSKIKAIQISSVASNSEEFLGYDSFGFAYQINNNVFSKVKGAEFFEYKNVSLGEITKVDLQNPLKMVLFYEDFNTVVLLDNQLNKMTEINFSLNPTPIVVSAIGMSTQNQLWIYNALNQQIGLFDYLKNEYKTVSLPLTEPIKYYHTDFNTFYWIDRKNNWYSCDIFGKTTSLGNVPNFDKIEIIDAQKYIFSNGNILYLRDINKEKTAVISEIEILQKSFDNFYYKDQILSIFTAKEILNYKIVTP